MPNSRVTLYLWPNFSPILNLKCGVFLRLRVEEEMEGEPELEEEDELEEEKEGERLRCLCSRFLWFFSLL